MKGTVTIVGAGPGVGAAVARRFGREGHPVALVARNRDRLDGTVLQPAGGREPHQARAGHHSGRSRSRARAAGPGRRRGRRRGPAKTCASAAEALLFSTGSAALTPSPERATSGVTYGAENVYVQILHKALAPEGIHVNQTVIVGPARANSTSPPRWPSQLWQQHVRRDEPLTVIR
jgi:hypothetical protein